jgi:glutamine amidotransferase
MSVAIIDYEAGNLTSVQRALTKLGADSIITADPEAIARADRVIFPGVGASASCMGNLQRSGMDQALRAAVASGRPVLGICVGMQLLLGHSAEDGGVDCVGLLPGQVRRFEPADSSLKVPHMGWNPVRFAAGEPLAVGIEAGSAFYFVHSYYCQPERSADVMAWSDHGHEFCAGVRCDNLAAVQFHPEKSGPVGLKFLANFLEA